MRVSRRGLQTPMSTAILLKGLQGAQAADELTDARRYFKQSEIVLYRQLPEQANLPVPQPQIPPERAVIDGQIQAPGVTA